MKTDLHKSLVRNIHAVYRAKDPEYQLGCKFRVKKYTRTHFPPKVSDISDSLIFYDVLSIVAVANILLRYIRDSGVPVFFNRRPAEGARIVNTYYVMYVHPFLGCPTWPVVNGAFGAPNTLMHTNAACTQCLSARTLLYTAAFAMFINMNVNISD